MHSRHLVVLPYTLAPEQNPNKVRHALDVPQNKKKVRKQIKTA